MTTSVKDRDDEDAYNLDASALVAAWRWRSEETPLVLGILERSRREADEATRAQENFMVVVLFCVS